MISKKELMDIAKLKGLNLGNAEKDYLIDIALLSISRNTKNELVFKGGTCLYKFHKLNRFSEDLDFSVVSDIDIDILLSKLINDFQSFGIKIIKHKTRMPFDSMLVTLRIEGPLFSGIHLSYASLGLDFNFKSAVIIKPELKYYESNYQDIPSISIPCMTLEEIFAEKIRAIVTRKRARDLFDIYFLIKKSVFADRQIIENKMAYYNLNFNLKELLLRIKELRNYWLKELAGFTQNLPEFDEVAKQVAAYLKNKYIK